MVGKAKSYVGELRREFKRINWPSRNDTIRLSAVVIVISLLVAMFLGALDYIFVYLLEVLIA